MQDESVRELPLEVGQGVMGGENATFGIVVKREIRKKLTDW